MSWLYQYRQTFPKWNMYITSILCDKALNSVCRLTVITLKTMCMLSFLYIDADNLWFGFMTQYSSQNAIAELSVST